MERVDQGLVELEHRLAAGHDDQSLSLALTPQATDVIGQRFGVGELPPTSPVGADEIRVAELANRLAPVLLAPAP